MAYKDCNQLTDSESSVFELAKYDYHFPTLTLIVPSPCELVNHALNFIMDLFHRPIYR